MHSNMKEHSSNCIQMMWNENTKVTMLFGEVLHTSLESQFCKHSAAKWALRSDQISSAAPQQSLTNIKSNDLSCSKAPQGVLRSRHMRLTSTRKFRTRRNRLHLHRAHLRISNYSLNRWNSITPLITSGHFLTWIPCYNLTTSEQYCWRRKIVIFSLYGTNKRNRYKRGRKLPQKYSQMHHHIMEVQPALLNGTSMSAARCTVH